MTGAHCNACRNDAAWLMDAARFYAGVPGVGAAAPCGKPWGWQGEGEPIITPEQREEIAPGRFSICTDGECEHVGRTPQGRIGCRLVERGSPCAFRQFIRDPLAACPTGRWSAVELTFCENVTTGEQTS